jgi:7-cyano-7-deazaguanine synthase
MKSVVVLHSGGMDSTVCVLVAKRDGHKVLSLGFDYGQRLRVELQYAEAVCQKWEIERRVITFEWRKPAREIPLDRSVDEMARAVSPAFLPARNVIFLTLGLAEATGIGADEVWIGINAVEFSGYPDCTPAFLLKFQEMAAVAVPGGPNIEAPLLNMSKPEIARLAQSLGVGKDDTWSCYRPDFAPDGHAIPCGRCDACRLHEFAWKNL